MGAAGKARGLRTKTQFAVPTSGYEPPHISE